MSLFCGQTTSKLLARLCSVCVLTGLYVYHSYGNMERLPTPAERSRTGGAGVYYHVSIQYFLLVFSFDVSIVVV